MIKLIDYYKNENGSVVFLNKATIGGMKRYEGEGLTWVWNDDREATVFNFKETPEEILAMPDIEEGSKAIDWEERRYEIAKHVLPRVFVFGEHKYSAKYAVSYADALIKELKKGGEK